MCDFNGLFVSKRYRIAHSVLSKRFFCLFCVNCLEMFSFVVTVCVGNVMPFYLTPDENKYTVMLPKFMWSHYLECQLIKLLSRYLCLIM